MDWKKELFRKDEKPLERLVESYSYTSVFRKMAFVGDSLSSGEFQLRDPEGKSRYHDMFEYSWGQYIARANGLLAYNFSKGGMTAQEYVDTFAAERGYWDKDKAAQAYVIALGVNDIYNQHREIGTLEDVHPEDYTKNAKNFIGYYAQIVSRYKEISPDAKFFFVTFPNEPGRREKEERDIVIKLLYGLCDIFDNCYVIDLYKYGPEYDAEFGENLWMFGHMNPMGYIVTARLIDSYIDYIVRHNPKDFQTIGFVTKDIEYKW
jgi:hypothetical protein